MTVDGAKKRLLVVDDEKAIRHLLKRVAERAGFEVDCAADGVEALEKLEQNEYAIAIVDLMMPRINGYELVQKISALDPRPVVLVATAMTNADVKSLDDSLVRRVIRKPFDINAVAQALIDTAKNVAEQQGLAASVVEVAPPEAAKVPIAAAEPEEPDVAIAAAAPSEEPKIEEPPANGPAGETKV